MTNRNTWEFKMYGRTAWRQTNTNRIYRKLQKNSNNRNLFLQWDSPGISLDKEFNLEKYYITMMDKHYIRTFKVIKLFWIHLLHFFLYFHAPDFQSPCLNFKLKISSEQNIRIWTVIRANYIWVFRKN